jgi:hypothetical protein
MPGEPDDTKTPPDPPPDPAPEISTPPLAAPDAAGKVVSGASKRLGETIDTAGKAFAAIAGLGIFFFATGYFVEWQKFKRGGLPPDEILPLISKAQVAAAGVRELAISIFFGVLVLAVLGWGGARIARWATGQPDGSWPRRLLARGFERDATLPTLVVTALILLFVPLNWGGVLVTVVLALLLYYSLRLIAGYLRDAEQDGEPEFPLWRLVIAAALAAAVLSGARQREFPEVRPHVLVTLTHHRTVKGSYVSSDSDEVLIRFKHGELQPQLLILDRDEVENMLLEKGQYVFPPEESLFGRITGLDFSCIAPECRAGDSRVGISSLF